MSQYHTSILAAALALTSSLSLAQARPDLSGSEIASSGQTLTDTIIVTASRNEQTLEQTLEPVTVITRTDIERLQAQSLPQLLNGLPGVSLGSNGGYGQPTSLFLRGTNSDHVLVLIDGIKIGSATSGTTALEQIPVDQIERIELVRGPRSSLYGAEAIGGVLQVFTRKGSATLTPSFMVGGGSQGLARAQAGLSGSQGQAWYSGSVAGLRTTGINACSGVPGLAGCFADQPDRDSNRSGSGSLRAGYRFGDTGEISVDWLRVYSTVEFDGDYGNEAHQVQQLLGTTLSVSPLQAWRTSLAAGQSQDRANTFQDGAYFGRSNTVRSSLSWQNDLQLSKTQGLNLGLDYLKDHLNSDTAYTGTDRENLGAFAQYQGSFGAQQVQLSLRGDDNQQFGYHYTGSAAWGYRLLPQLRLLASYATAFHAPTFNDLYYPFGLGNPDLHPEKSRSGEVGFETRLAGIRWALRGYQTFIDDLIAYNSVFSPANIDRARIRGLESEWNTRWMGVQTRLSANWLEPIDRSRGSTRNNTLPRRARQTARLDLDREFGRWQLGGTVYTAGHRYDDAANTQRLGSYATLDLRGGWRFTPQWLLQLQAANLLNKDYQTAAYYNQPGSSWFLSLRYSPQ